MIPILEVSNIVKKYKNHFALNNLNMTVKRGDIYGFVGENGSGKTTIIRIITGLVFADSGSFKLFGNNNNDNSILEARRKVGAIVESPSIYKNMSAKENLLTQATILGIKNDAKIKEILEYVGLGELYDDPKNAGNFSLGMRQRLGIAMALLGNPEFIMLDEPMNGLDPAGIVDVRNLILKLNKEKNITFLISSHILSELSLIATRYGIISKGRIIKEISANELKNECRKYIKLSVDELEKAYSLLEDKYCKENLKCYGSNIYLYGENNINELVGLLTANNINISSINTVESNIEDYYLSLIGGVTNA